MVNKKITKDEIKFYFNINNFISKLLVILTGQKY